MDEGIKVLYVDDEPVLLEIARLFLEETGNFQVSTLASAEKALASPSLSSYDLILSDYLMPGLDGIAFLKEVRHRYGDIPFILFTGRGREEVVIEALNEGADFYLQKGGDPTAQFTELAHKIRQAVAQKRADKELRSSRANLEQKNRILTLLHDLEQEFAGLPYGKRVENMAAKKLIALTGAVMACFNTYDPDRQEIRCTAFDLEPGILERLPGAWEKATKLLGVEPTSIVIPLNRDMYKDINRSIVGKKNSVAEISYGKISPLVSIGIQKLSGIDRFFHIAHIIDGELFGTSVFGLRPDQPDPPQELLESFAHMVAVSLRRQWAETALQKSEGSYRGLFNTIQQALYILDREGKFVDVNAGAERMYGYTRDEFNGRTPEFLSAPGRNDVVAVAEKIQRAFTGEPQHFGFWGLRRNGEVFPKDVFLYRGTYFGKDIVLAVGIDITERQLAENVVRESENKFATVFRSNPVTLTLVSATDGKFVDVNDAFLANTGYSREDVIDRTSQELGIFADLREYEQLVTRLRCGQPVKGMELHIRQKNGEVRTCQFSSGIVLMQGRPHILSTVEDVTSRKNADLAFQAMTMGMVGATGREALDRITESISSWLGADCIMIGEILPDQKRVHVLSMLLDGKKVKDYFYILKGTPCDNTVEKGFCLYMDNVAGIFPESRDLRELNIRGYAGTPLRNAGGSVIGILCILTRKPLMLPAEGRKILDIMAVKAAVEIERKQGGERLARINEALLHLGTDHKKNIDDLAQLTGEMLDADYVLYNRLEGGLLCIMGQWKCPADMPALDTPEGHICFDVIRKDRDGPLVVCDLQKSPYAQTDSNVAAYGLKTYIGHPVRYGNIIHGSLCAVYTRHITPTVEYQKIIGILSSAIAQEEERRENQRELQESEERFRSFIGQALEGISLVDEEGRIVEWNPAQEKITGIPRSEVLGVCAWDLATRMIPDKHRMAAIRSRMEESIKLTIKSGKNTHPDPVFYTFHRPDGTIAIAKQTVFIVKTPHGHMIGTLNQDVTEERRADEKIKESEASYRGLFNTLLHAIYILDKDGKFIDVNEGAEVMYGYTREEFIGKTPEFISAPGKNDLTAVSQYLRKTFAGEPQQFEFWGQKKNNEIFPKEVRLYRGTYFGKDVIIANGMDITERKNAEEALLQVNRKLNLLTGITRHDIKNQLLTLNGFLEISKKYLGDAQKMSEFIDKERKIAKTMERQISFTREYEAIGINAPVWQDCHRFVDAAATQVPLGNIKIKNDLPAGLEIFADPLIMKVCYNLMENAVRHGKKVSTIRFSVDGSDNEHIVVCEDDGVGIPADLREQIFVRGFGKNTGMGLFLAREILSITGITICETGEPGKGARFEINVPKGAWRYSGMKGYVPVHSPT